MRVFRQGKNDAAVLSISETQDGTRGSVPHSNRVKTEPGLSLFRCCAEKAWPWEHQGHAAGDRAGSLGIRESSSFLREKARSYTTAATKSKACPQTSIQTREGFTFPQELTDTEPQWDPQPGKGTPSKTRAQGGGCTRFVPLFFPTPRASKRE